MGLLFAHGLCQGTLKERVGLADVAARCLQTAPQTDKALIVFAAMRRARLAWLHLSAPGPRNLSLRRPAGPRLDLTGPL
ncbi:unnamed protein product [Merluccius merluccius]